MRARIRSPGPGTTRALGGVSTATRGRSPSSSLQVAGKAWRCSGSASVGISSTVTAGSVAVRRMALRLRAMKPSASISFSSTLKGVRMSPLMPKRLARSRLPSRLGSSAMAARMSSRLGNVPVTKARWRGAAVFGLAGMVSPSVGRTRPSIDSATECWERTYPIFPTPSW